MLFKLHKMYTSTVAGTWARLLEVGYYEMPSITHIDEGGGGGGGYEQD